jgi:hypothetical protein
MSMGIVLSTNQSINPHLAPAVSTSSLDSVIIHHYRESLPVDSVKAQQLDSSRDFD